MQFEKTLILKIYIHFAILFALMPAFILERLQNNTILCAPMEARKFVLF